jgi:hypothetical protein
MPNNTGKILKRDNVVVAGQRQLGVAPSRPATSPKARPQGRITGQDEHGAIVEITCGCGEVIHLHCAYQQTEPPNGG